MINHLTHSFFVSNKSIELDLNYFKVKQIGDFYIGYFLQKEAFGAINDFITISFETLEVFNLKENLSNSVSIHQRKLEITGSDMNTQAIYYIHNQKAETFIVYNDMFLSRFLLKSCNLPIDYNINQLCHDLTFFSEVRRLKFGEKLTLTGNGGKWNLQKEKKTNIIQSIGKYDFETSKSVVFEELNKSILRNTNTETEYNISLSGGIDSGTIAYLLKNNNRKFRAYSLGTEWGDEFKEAQETADYIDIKLEKINFSKEEIINEIPNIIRFYSFIIPTKIEVALIAHCLYKRLFKINSQKCFVTGYGSDLLNGGVFQSFSTIQDLENQILEGLYDTQISNEFSNLTALNYGVKTIHPYWDKHVIIETMKVPAELKVINNQDKYYFRKMMEPYLPQSIVWRKKIGAHQGTGLSQHLKTNKFSNIGIYYFNKNSNYHDMIINIHKEIFSKGNYSN